jgi:uncharacterized integral membrane protein
MKILFWLIITCLIVLGMFSVANWDLLTAPASINLLVFTVEGPLGMILLGAALVLAALCTVYVLWLRTTTLMELRQHTRDLEAQRALADRAEASRFTELRVYIGEEAGRQRTLVEEVRDALNTRVDAFERTLLGSVQEASNTLAAYVGEVDEKLNRLAPQIEKRP